MKVGYDGDGDGLTDYEETELFKTDPNKWDSDEDGFSGGEEIAEGTDPLDPESYPKSGLGGIAEFIVMSLVIFSITVLGLLKKKEKKS